MSFAYLALFTGDYLRDTRHLSCSEHGVYLLLLMHCWDAKGPVPLDERKQMGICGARSGDELEALRRVLGEFFVRMEDGYYNHRMQLEVEKAENLSRTLSSAGRRGYEAKAKRLPSLRKAEAKPRLLSSSPSSSLSLTPESEAIASSAKALPAEVATIVESIPLNDGTDFQVTESFANELRRLYPAVDTEQTLHEIRGWNLAHPTQRKTRRGITAHINGWFQRDQNRG